MWQSLYFNKVAGLCFPVNFVKFLRTPFLQNTSGRLLLSLTKNLLLNILAIYFPVKLIFFPVKLINAPLNIDCWLVIQVINFWSVCLNLIENPLRQLPIKTLSKSLLLITIPLITNNVLLIIIYSGDVHKCSTCPKLKGTLMQIWKFQCRLGFV